MRIWDVSVQDLCQKHLLGEHRELHAIWTILTQNRKGYSSHPETKRWIGKLGALYQRHEEEVAEMKKRGYNHHSNLQQELAVGSVQQDKFVSTLSEQRIILTNKVCTCYQRSK